MNEHFSEVRSSALVDSGFSSVCMQRLLALGLYMRTDYRVSEVCCSSRPRGRNPTPRCLGHLVALVTSSPMALLATTRGGRRRHCLVNPFSSLPTAAAPPHHASTARTCGSGRDCASLVSLRTLYDVHRYELYEQLYVYLPPSSLRLHHHHRLLRLG